MSTFVHEWRALPSPPRWTTAGAIVIGILGGIAGLVVGLIANPPTAWAAVFELGIPAALVGAILGIVVDLVVLLGRRLRRQQPVR